MQLNATIAKQIVHRAMKIIRYSVNVMDEHGHIIGSGDPSRLNQRHEGAVLALSERRSVEIDQAMAEKLKGVRPGINLPILFGQQAIGVVGISGDPDLVRNYGELVKMTAELIVEQAALMAQVQWNKRHREELVLQLILANQRDESQLLAIAAKLELDLNQPRIAAVVTVDGAQSISLDHLQQLVHLLEYPERDNLVGIVSVSANEVVVLKPVTLKNGNWCRDKEQKRVRQLLKRVDKLGQFQIRMALGGYFPGLSGLSQSYQSAKATLRCAAADAGAVLFYQDHILPVLLDGLHNDPWRQQQLEKPRRALQAGDPKGNLLKTLTVFFAQNCDLAQTCQALHIHRNTLRYRLEKIEQITSLSFNKIDDKTRLYLSLSQQGE